MPYANLKLTRKRWELLAKELMVQRLKQSEQNKLRQQKFRKKAKKQIKEKKDVWKKQKTDRS